MTVKSNPLPPGAVELHGASYLRNAKGDLTAVANIKAADLLMDEAVRKILAYGKDLSAELARFRAHSEADIAAHDALLAQEYGAPDRETKGNRTLSTFDGLGQVKVAVADNVVYGPELQIAKSLLDDMINERAAGADGFLVTLVNQAFRVNQEGKVDRASILALRRLEVADPRWTDVCRAIDDAVRVIGSKSYIRLYERETPTGQWKLVPLDLASVAPTPEAFARRSLRRQVEDGRKTLAAALDHLMDGDVPSAASVLAQLLVDLGGEVSPDVTQWRRMGCENYFVKMEDEVVS